jgi:hypothetical protein
MDDWRRPSWDFVVAISDETTGRRGIELSIFLSTTNCPMGLLAFRALNYGTRSITRSV